MGLHQSRPAFRPLRESIVAVQCHRSYQAELKRSFDDFVPRFITLKS